MKAWRTLLICACAAAGFVLLAVGTAFWPPVQTWAARKAIASMAPQGSSLGRVSIGLNRMSLQGLRLEMNGSVLEVPTAEAQLGVISAFLGRGYLVKSLVARGWTLDLARGPGATPVSEARRSWATRALGGMLAAFNVPAHLSLEKVELEGRVILPGEGGRPAGTADVAVTGGGLAEGRGGRFLCEATVSLDDRSAPVSSVAVKATFEAAMDESGTFTQASLRGDATASGRQFPRGIRLSCAAMAARNQGRISYSFSLVRGNERIAEIDADNPGASSRMAGAWRLDLKDTDLAPFALGRKLPAFHVAGQGSYELNTSTGDVHAVGKLHASADRLGLVAGVLDGLGQVELAADFDIARLGDSLRVDRLETSLTGAAPVASVRALQPFEFNPSTGELKVARPTGDLVGISLGGLPLPWLKGLLAGDALEGGDARGEFVMRAEDGRLALRTREPLRAAGVSLACAGRPVASGLDVSAFVLADYSPQGWQVQVAPLDIRNAGIEIISLEARLGRLAGAGQVSKAAGSWSVSLPALMSQPIAARLPRLTGGDASGSFEASLGSIREVRAKLVLRDLALLPGKPVVLPAITSEVRADFDGHGRATVNLPLHLDFGSRTADIALSGAISEQDGTPVVSATISGGCVSADDIMAIAALCGGAPAASGPAGTAAPPAPFWPRVSGLVSLRLASLALPGIELGDVRMLVVVDPASFEVRAGSANFGDASSARVDGELSFAPAAELPYSLLANIDLDNVDSAPLFRSIDPNKPPAIEGRFELTSRLTASGRALAELLPGVQGTCRLSSKDGRFRALSTDVMDAIKRAPSKLVDALDSVASLFGKRTDRIGEALVESAKGLSEIHYDQMTISAERGADLDIRIAEISLIAPEERITGSGRIAHVEGVPIQAQPLSIDLEMGVRGRVEKFLGIVGMLKDGKDELGYTQLYEPIHLGGSLQHIDQSQWRGMLVQASAKKGGGLIDNLLGR